MWGIRGSLVSGGGIKIGEGKGEGKMGKWRGCGKGKRGGKCGGITEHDSSAQHCT